MKLYYESPLVRLYHGDSREASLGSDAYDMILMDPPYGVEFVSGKRQADLFGPITGDDDANLGLEILRHSLESLRRARHVYCFGLKDFGDLKLSKGVELIWDKQIIGMGDLTLPWGPEHERILFGVYELSRANLAKGYGRLAARLRQGSVLREIRKNSAAVTRHPTEKPVGILRQMIESSTVLGETVYDPTCGAASTLVAAVMSGRQAIGVEIEERWCEIGAIRLERIERAVTTLLAADLAPAVVRGR